MTSPLLDEMFSGAIAEQLRAKGHDVIAVVADPALICPGCQPTCRRTPGCSDQRPAGQGPASTEILACGESRDADSERQGVSTSMVTGTPLVMTS